MNYKKKYKALKRKYAGVRIMNDIHYADNQAMCDANIRLLRENKKLKSQNETLINSLPMPE